MSFVQVEKKGNYAILTLDRGKSNPLNQAFINELSATLLEIENESSIKGLVISGKENFFSAGLDLIEMSQFSRNEYINFWKDFSKFLITISKFPKPLVAAITGHSPAGGCIIGICCDYRVMAKGNYKIGLNEIPVGIIVPKGIMALYSRCIGERLAYQYLMEGKLMDGNHAHSIGLVDELAEPYFVLEAAERKIMQYLSFNQNAWKQTKLNLKASVLQNLDFSDDTSMELSANQWFSEECQIGIANLLEGLKKK